MRKQKLDAAPWRLSIHLKNLEHNHVLNEAVAGSYHEYGHLSEEVE